MFSFAAEPAAKIGNPPQCHGWGVRQICYDPKDREWRRADQPNKEQRVFNAARAEYQVVLRQSKLQKIRDDTAALRATLRN